MTAPRNTDRLIREFLEEGRNELPDRAYDAVRAQIDHTRQRVFIGPWRFNLMNTYARYAIGAGAIVLVALLGIQLFSLGGGVGKSTPSPAPTATPAPTPTPTAAPTAAPHRRRAPHWRLWRVTAWHIHLGKALPGTRDVRPASGMGRQHGRAICGRLKRIGGPELTFQMFDKVYADPCDFTKGPMNPKPGASVADWLRRWPTYLT